jgi:hypothetical protein
MMQAMSDRLVPGLALLMRHGSPFLPWLVRSGWWSVYWSRALWQAAYQVLGVKLDYIPLPDITDRDISISMSCGMRLVYWAPELEEQISLRTMLTYFQTGDKRMSVGIPFSEKSLVHSSKPGWYFVFADPLVNQDEEKAVNQYRAEYFLLSALDYLDPIDSGMQLPLPVYLLFVFMNSFIDSKLPDDGSQLLLHGTRAGAELHEICLLTDQRLGALDVVTYDSEKAAALLAKRIRFCIYADQFRKLQLPSR